MKCFRNDYEMGRKDRSVRQNIVPKTIFKPSKTIQNPLNKIKILFGQGLAL